MRILDQFSCVRPYFFLFTMGLSLYFSYECLGISSNKRLVTTLYAKELFGHLHQNPSIYSTTLDTFACGRPIEVFENKENSIKGWEYVKVGNQFGYVLKNALSSEKPRCFQRKYPEFFNALNFSIKDLYFWGKLYDQYLNGVVKIY